MRYLSEFRNPEIAAQLLKKIRKSAEHAGRVNFMEVCGTHTMSLHRYGIKNILPDNIRLLSGPGCPVCVTPNEYIDKAIAYSQLSGMIITTFGDMMRVPGSVTSLEKVKAEGADVRIVYSTLDALKIARSEPDKTVIFLGVGFETTSPTIAASMVKAREERTANYRVYCAHKVMPPALTALARDPELKIDGFICPAHVSAIIGISPYQVLADTYKIGCVVAGFEPIDMLRGILMLIEQTIENSPRVENEYDRVVKPGGNPKIQSLLQSVFEPTDARWRGIGIIPESGYRIGKTYEEMDIEVVHPVRIEPPKEPAGCRCGDVLRGMVQPPECSLFGTLCTPETPVGACMVSTEGTCAAHYRYNLPENNEK